MAIDKINQTSIKKSTLLGLGFLLITAILTLTGLPKSPFSIIKNVKKASNQVELTLPSNSLSQSLAVNACSEESLEKIYDSAENFNTAKSGLNVFKARLSKEYKDGSKSFANLANKILVNTASASSNSKTCLLPLKFSADSSLAQEIKNSELLDVSLGEQSVLCSKGKAFLDAQSSLFSVTGSLESYSKYIKDKKVVVALKKKLASLQLKKAKLSASKQEQKAKLDQEIRKLNISLAYATYFSKDALLLGSFFDSICKQAAVTATPNTENKRPTATPVTQATATSIPTIKITNTIPIITTTPTRTPTNTRTSTPTFTTVPGRLSAPTFTSPQVVGTVTPVNGQVIINWNPVTDATGYLIGVVNKTLSTERDELYIENHGTNSYALNVVAGNQYRFWARARKLNYNQNDLSTHSELSEIIFTVAGQAATPIPTFTATAVVTNTASPNCTPGQTQPRTYWQEELVAPGQSCVSEPQTWTCNSSAVWVRSTGTFTKTSCMVDSSEINSCASGKASSITQYGITWTFDTEYNCGQFVNGDYWVIPKTGVNQNKVKIVDINPKSAIPNAFAGSMINPMPNQSQGLYYRMNDTTKQETTTPTYDPNKNIALNMPSQPYLVSANNSVYSTMPSPHTWWAPPGAGIVEKTYFKETAILTVLGSPPLAGSFRPPYTGTDKTIKSNWNANNIHFEVLQNYLIPNQANAPSIAWLERAIKRPVIEINNHGQSNSDFKASWDENKTGGYPRRAYGREMADIGGAAGLLLNTKFSDDPIINNNTKRKLAIYMIQWGIDIYALRKEGLQFWGQGGHQNGRLLPVFIAAKLLNDPEIKAIAGMGAGFSENAQHFVVNADHVNKKIDAGNLPYTSKMIGMPEFCPGDQWASNLSSLWEAPPGVYTWYRFVAGGAVASNVAVLLIMNARGDLGYAPLEPLIRYQLERYYPREKTINRDGNNIQRFAIDMWDTYIKIAVPPKTYCDYLDRNDCRS